MSAPWSTHMPAHQPASPTGGYHPPICDGVDDAWPSAKLTATDRSTSKPSILQDSSQGIAERSNADAQASMVRSDSYEMTATNTRAASSASQARQPQTGIPHEAGCPPPLPRQVPPLRRLLLLSAASHEHTVYHPLAPGIVTMLQFQIPSFAIFNNIVLFALYAVVLYIVLCAMFKPFFSSQGHPLPCYGSARPSRRPIARVGPNKVVFKHASSGKNAYSLHQFGKTAVYKAIQTCVTRVLATSGPATSGPTTTMRAYPDSIPTLVYTPHYASNYLAFFQPEIHGFTRGLVKTIDSETPLLSRLLQAKYSASESIPDRDIVSAERSRSPDTVAKLQAVPDASMPEPLAIPDIRVLQHLPYLSPLIQDGLRVHDAVPSLPERVLPSHLQKQCLPRVLRPHGLLTPLGTCTRDPTAFPPALTFLPDPDRWLSAIEDQLAQVQAHIMPFRMGSCIWGNGARDDDDTRQELWGRCGGRDR
ncbi:hypothetical protein FIBSPDRAFT_889811 [Athelia psychrophila]|uniref:Uncharacterized protein n=1 Tax=Athelia psychrophila TaxID=1759441 RepID=A0A166LP50_9AGAM|nr:hypothetical protein FIBSPDRAFT_889811 [Fibularhizoctonia sp. CBS 109695]